MKTATAFPSDYLKASDLNGKEVKVKIGKVELVEMGQGNEKKSKLLIHFNGKQKGLVVNVTNCNTIEKLYGDETDNWVGKEIILAPREVEFQGEMVWAIRVSLQKPGTVVEAPVAGNDDVPF